MSLLKHRQAHIHRCVSAKAQRRKVYPPDNSSRTNAGRHASEAAIDLVEEVALLRPFD